MKIFCYFMNIPKSFSVATLYFLPSVSKPMWKMICFLPRNKYLLWEAMTLIILLTVHLMWWFYTNFHQSQLYRPVLYLWQPYSNSCHSFMVPFYSLYFWTPPKYVSNAPNSTIPTLQKKNCVLTQTSHAVHCTVSLCTNMLYCITEQFLLKGWQECFFVYLFVHLILCASDHPQICLLAYYIPSHYFC
jgi:hypothetical protein